MLPIVGTRKVNRRELYAATYVEKHPKRAQNEAEKKIGKKLSNSNNGALFQILHAHTHKIYSQVVSKRGGRQEMNF